MSRSALLDPARPVLEQLRERIAAVETGAPAEPIPTHPIIAELIQLRAGGCYAVDSTSLALALAGEASRSGEWVGFAGWDDLGAEAAVALGVDLARTLVVPDVGEHWLEVVVALVDVARLVVLRPPTRVDARTAAVVDARLRKRSSALVVHGPWPRCEARLSVEQVTWQGTDGGRGRLRSRRALLSVRRGDAPAVEREVWFPGETEALTPVLTPAESRPVSLRLAAGS